MDEYTSHWNKVYANANPENTGWYQETAEPSLELIASCNLDKNATILNVGTGASTMINDLLQLGYSDVLVNDISKEALSTLKRSILSNNLSNIQFIEDDITEPLAMLNIPKVDLWHDRAVLHFFLEKEQQDAYFNLLKSKVKVGGFVIIAEFHKSGVLKCSGLELCRYDAESIQEKLGDDFKLVKDFQYTYINPSGGERPYIYTLFQRKK
ncbi:MAG: methyltransferase domain-containing protein [Flavobacteriaceae bacterium]|nr:methyltransferase domain-containing protein [Flavobacteriaceae bacterium]